MLFNEPKLLKSPRTCARRAAAEGFSALQRAEIAEINLARKYGFEGTVRFSALQRAEIAEISRSSRCSLRPTGFSALQRAEIAEIFTRHVWEDGAPKVSVLFNEPKLLK